MKVTIDRAKWLTGRRKDRRSVLLDGEGRMCCLGFVAKACGATDEEIRHAGYPSFVLKVSWPDGMLMRHGITGNYVHTAITTNLMDENDNALLLDGVREQKIAEGLANLGVEVTFIGEYDELP